METLEHFLQSKNIVFKEADLHIYLKPNDMSCSQPICPGDGCPALSNFLELWGILTKSIF